MAENSKIEWTDHTFNPWIGCTQVGPGCDRCYAKALDKRTGGDHWGPGVSRRRTKDWRAPYRWQKHAGHYQALHGRRQRVFCASMADVFDNEVPDDWRADLWQVIRDTAKLDWLIVTKRIGNAKGMLPPDWPQAFPHVILLATVVNQIEADRDIPKLLATPAAMRGISAEPLLGPLDLRQYLIGHEDNGVDLSRDIGGKVGACTDWTPPLDWVIVGGESGPGSRPMHPDWARSIRDQCANADVSFFFKQWGAWLVGERQPENEDPTWMPDIVFQDGSDFAVVSDGHDILLAAAEDDAEGPKHHWREYWGWQGHLIKRAPTKSLRLLDGRTHDDIPSPIMAEAA